MFQSDEEITEMIFTSNSIPSKALVLFSSISRAKRAILSRFSYHLCNSSTPKRGDRRKQDKVKRGDFKAASVLAVAVYGQTHPNETKKKSQYVERRERLFLV